MKKYIKNSCKGASIFELMTALAVVMIIMIASISLLKSSTSISIKSSAIIEANNTVESIIECFNYSNDEAEFIASISNLHGKCSTPTTVEKENNVTTYIIDCGSYKIIITHTDNVPLIPADDEDSIAIYSKVEINAIYSNDRQIYKENKIYYKYKG